MGRAGRFGTGKGRVCAVVAAGSAAEMRRQVRVALRETPTVELRLDWLRSDAERAKLLAWVGEAKFSWRDADGDVPANCGWREIWREH